MPLLVHSQTDLSVSFVLFLSGYRTVTGASVSFYSRGSPAAYRNQHPLLLFFLQPMSEDSNRDTLPTSLSRTH